MKYHVGEIVEGKITGIQPYGAFVLLEDSVNGLIHISEISDGYVKDIHQYVKVGDTIQVKIIDLDEDNQQVRLSLKALHRKRAQSYRRTATLPEMKKGFTTIEAHMNEWVKEALKGEEQ